MNDNEALSMSNSLPPSGFKDVQTIIQAALHLMTVASMYGSILKLTVINPVNERWYMYEVELHKPPLFFMYRAENWNEAHTTITEHGILDALHMMAPAYVETALLDRWGESIQLFRSDDGAVQRNMAKINTSARTIQRAWRHASTVPNRHAEATSELAALEARRKQLKRVADRAPPDSLWRRKMARDANQLAVNMVEHSLRKRQEANT